MALVFRNSSEGTGPLCIEIAEALKKRRNSGARGIHSGPVSDVTDVSGRTNIAGAGINMAQRVMGCGDAGHILLSQHVADDLAQYRQWAPLLHDLGECEVNMEFVSTFSIFTPSTSATRTNRRNSGSQMRRKPRRRWQLPKNRREDPAG